MPPADKMFRLVNTGYITETTADGQPRLGVVTVRDAEGTVVAQADIGVDGTWSVPHLQPDTSYTLSFNSPDDDPVFYQGSDNVLRNYSIVASTGTDQRAVQTISGGMQTLSDPVVLVTVDDCVYIAPSQPEATPTDTSTPTSTLIPDTPTSTVIPDTPTSTTISIPNPSATAMIGSTGASYKDYLTVVLQR